MTKKSQIMLTSNYDYVASEHATLESNTEKDVSDIMSTSNEDRYDIKDSNSMSNKEPTKAIFNKNVQNIDEYIIRFLNSNLTNLSITFLMAYILSFKKDMPFRVYSFKFPYSNSKHSKYSFSTISIEILNLFLFNYITKNDTKTKFKNGISYHFTLLKFYNIYCKES
jgi:hypothetical protein